jgi:hypothetical protein
MLTMVHFPMLLRLAAATAPCHVCVCYHFILTYCYCYHDRKSHNHIIISSIITTNRCMHIDDDTFSHAAVVATAAAPLAMVNFRALLWMLLKLRWLCRLRLCLQVLHRRCVNGLVW